MSEKTIERSDPNAFWTVVIGILSVLVTFATIIGLQALYYKVEDSEWEKKVVAQPPEELIRIKSQQLSNINSYRWVSKAEGIAGIPIERAMEVVIKDPSALQPVPPTTVEGTSSVVEEQAPQVQAEPDSSDTPSEE